MSNPNINPASKHPSQIIWQVIGDSDKSHWVRVGSAWQNRDGRGLSLRFDAYPVAGRTVIREEGTHGIL